ncbi:methyl-accepting chemotaxis protein [Rheinheimera pacifica]|uniref:methyl-accepting chemotaxis protein n=1 Tax=Rheinheimera pacifica TaxID=173990 RepID=UPI002863F89D|nr:methyl-accepting chemotaxis protein [Rheinheimera pacifica]MDR6983541.1 methyl-accepting chemotaxis protein [Rheinheimera pacifica]
MMTFYINLKTGQKLTLMLGILALLFLMLQLHALSSLQQVQQSQLTLYHEAMQPLLQLEEIRIDINEQRARMLGGSLRGELTADDEAGLGGTLQQRQQVLDNVLQQLNKHQMLQPALLELRQLHTQYIDTTAKQILPLLRQQQMQQAQTLLLDIQTERVQRFRTLAADISNTVKQQVEHQLAASDQLLNDQRQAMLVGMTLVLLVIAAVIWSLNRALVLPLTTLTRIAKQAAAGEQLGVSGFEQRRDEVGLLSRAFADMGDYLVELSTKAQSIAAGDLREQIQPRSERDILGQSFNTMSNNLRQLIGELNEGIEILASSSQEILTTTTQVVTSAQQTASAVHEISTTIDEVKQTANMASQKAKHVSDSARQTTQITQDGRNAVTSALEGMTAIREQMQAMSESIIRLNEQSQTVGDIVATVADLAEQSNLLGVNASIEAVKAGEQGKGFSVVAQEVKSLAEQSRNATVQVRTILNDIQKAMNKVVLVTEQGGRAVDAGYNQTRLSGEAILALAAQFEQSSDAAMQIAASSQQQLIGMDQVATAMRDINNASQNNVAGARQAEQAAKALHDLGHKLKQRAATFRT